MSEEEWAEMKANVPQMTENVIIIISDFDCLLQHSSLERTLILIILDKTAAQNNS